MFSYHLKCLKLQKHGYLISTSLGRRCFSDTPFVMYHKELKHGTMLPRRVSYKPHILISPRLKWERNGHLGIEEMQYGLLFQRKSFPLGVLTHAEISCLVCRLSSLHLHMLCNHAFIRVERRHYIYFSYGHNNTK